MNLTHHAYLYEGPLSLLPELALDAKARGGFGEHSPDFHVREFEKFGIEESRWLAQTAALRGASGRALFVIGAGSLTSESQQALLKLFEEPPQGTVFVLLVPHGVVLPTLRSRMLEYPSHPLAPQKVLGSPRPAAGRQARPDHFAGQADAPSLAAKFLRADQKSRSTQIAALLKDEEGAKERVRQLLLELEAALLPKIVDSNVRQGLEDIARVRSYTADRSASLKMLLEHLALSLPKL